MVFPANFEQKIGFDTVRDLVSGLCLSSAGRAHAGSMRFLTDRSALTPLLHQTEELRQLLLFHGPFPSQDYYDLSESLTRIRVAGSFLEPEEMAELSASLTAIQRILKYLASQPPDSIPELLRLTEGIHVEPSILKRIAKIIDEKAEIREDASPALKKIRSDRRAKQSVVEKQVRLRLKAARQAGWTPDEADLTIRNGRLVIPLLASHKRDLTGFIHDQSATGHTVYVEPAEALETNNEIRELDYAERREIVRILLEFSDFLRPHLDSLLPAYTFLGRIDFIRAKALFAMEIHALLPKTVSDRPLIDWKSAIHPLLFLSHNKAGKTVVPLTLRLNREERILIISGPNAGGKSVCLKSVGLLQYLFQCGLLPPVKEDSEFGMFEKIFIDIGDEQSLENDLSTYTSKLYHLKHFLERLDDRSLFLIDEFGTGTDPSLGGAIAEAGLTAMNRTGAFGVVTTHYSNLKLLAGREQGILNGAMLYDTARMRPLYQLKTGQPGSSFAFEIARQIGFPEEVLQQASVLTGQSQLDFDRQLQDLEVEKAALAQKASELRVADDFLHEMVEKYTVLSEKLEKQKKEIIQKAKDEALQILNRTNSTIEKTVREIRESQAEKEKTKAARQKIGKLKEDLVKEPPAPTPPPQPPARVFHSLDSIRLTADPSPKPAPSRPKGPYQSFYDDLQRKLQSFELTLDLRGCRADEAHGLIQRYIDDAILLTIPEVRILHGKGNGTLRQITRDYLATVKEIRSYRDERLEAGGAGITVVEFR